MALVDSFEGIIFDFGGVLVTDQTPDDQSRISQVAGIELNRLLDAYWADRLLYDRGDVTNVQYWEDIAKRCDASFNSQQIASLTDFDNQSWMHYDAVMWNWIDELKAAGKRVAILSNMPKDLGEALEAGTDRLKRFDHTTLSYRVRSAKPDPAIYEHCLDGIGTAPAQTLFLDDRIDNVNAAELLGIRSIQFLSRDSVLLKLKA